MNKILKIIIWPLLLAPLIYLAAVWNILPDKIGVHFDLKGNPDKFSDKSGMLINIVIIIVVAIAIYVLLPLSYKIDRKKRAIENKSRLQRLAFAIAVFMSLLACVVINNAQKGEGVRLNIKLIFGSIGLLWCISGNYMYNIKPNNFAGYRTRWTLNNEENWRKTHLLAGKLWFAGGLLVAVASFFTSGNTPIIAFISTTIIITLIPGIYSYLLHKKQTTPN
jgi:uncharacterized membrane protein